MNVDMSEKFSRQKNMSAKRVYKQPSYNHTIRGLKFLFSIILRPGYD